MANKSAFICVCAKFIVSLHLIFVDAMIADNNDDVKLKLDEMQKTLDELKAKLEEKQ